MTLQGSEEPIGCCKVTRRYHLPARYVLHTVGPAIVRGTKPTPKEKEQLSSCYESCLDAALEIGNVRSIAFCCICTGVFGFPQEEACKIAFNTVQEWMGRAKKRRISYPKVVFNVFTEKDEALYLDMASRSAGQLKSAPGDQGGPITQLKHIHRL